MASSQHTVDTVVREITIAAPIEKVWVLITQPEHLRVWYAFDGATVDLRTDGVIEHFWTDHGRYRGVIDEVTAPTRLSYFYSNVPDILPEPGRRTRVVFDLEPTPDGGTIVRVTESGFEDLVLSAEERQAYVDATTRGWSGGLEGLSAYAVQELSEI